MTCVKTLRSALQCCAVLSTAYGMVSVFRAVMTCVRCCAELSITSVYGHCLQVSENLLSLYLDGYDETPWDALKYLIAGINYGGHVTDDWDRRLLMTYINDLFTDSVLTQPFYKWVPCVFSVCLFCLHFFFLLQYMGVLLTRSYKMLASMTGVTITVVVSLTLGACWSDKSYSQLILYY